MAQYVAERAAACLGADYSNFALLDRTGRRTIHLFHGSSMDGTIAERYTEFDIDAPLPIAAAIRLSEVITLSGANDYAKRFPDLWEETVRAGFTMTVSVPLVRSDGTVMGGVGLAWSTAPVLDVRFDRALRALSQLCTEIVERAEVYDAQHLLVADLHERLLGPFPAMPGIEVAARYLASGLSSTVGGDWYEGVILDDNSLAVVVGDVCGHGLAAAADMALTRGIITAVLLDGAPPADVFDRVGKVLARRNEALLATAALVVVNAAEFTLTYATAGHPPPVLVDPEGHVTLLDNANRAMLGVSPTAHSTAATVPFPLGSALIMYTDGLVERRDRNFDAGIAEMVAALSASDTSAPAGDVIDFLLELLVGRDHADDIAVLVLRHVAEQ